LQSRPAVNIITCRRQQPFETAEPSLQPPDERAQPAASIRLQLAGDLTFTIMVW